jgi:hypothetical protein
MSDPLIPAPNRADIVTRADGKIIAAHIYVGGSCLAMLDFGPQKDTPEAREEIEALVEYLGRRGFAADRCFGQGGIGCSVPTIRCDECERGEAAR